MHDIKFQLHTKYRNKYNALVESLEGTIEQYTVNGRAGMVFFKDW